MPAVSQKERAYLNARFGHAWVKAHHFDNPGPLPKYAHHKGASMHKGTLYAHKARCGIK